MLQDASRAALFADAALAQGVFVTAYSYPVVPKGQARIRTQMSAALTGSDIDHVLAAFAEAKKVIYTYESMH